MFKKIQGFALSVIGKIRGLISSSVESLLMKRFADAGERAFVRDFWCEAMPVLIFIIGVYSIFGFLGFIEELLTITILASFAWCAKMEKYYGRCGISAKITDAYDPEQDRSFTIIPSEIIHLARFVGRKKLRDAFIIVGILTGQKQGDAIRFYIVPYNCPGYQSLDKLYSFVEIPKLFHDVNQIMEAEMESRNTRVQWAINWNHDVDMGYRSVWSGGDFFPGSFGVASRGAIIFLTSMYVWYWLRRRHKILGWLVRHIGENTGKIMYFFYRGEAVARKMRKGEQLPWPWE